MPIELIALGVAGLLGAGGMKIAKGPPGTDEPLFGGGRRRRPQLFGYLNDQPAPPQHYASPQQSYAPPQMQTPRRMPPQQHQHEAHITKTGNCFRAECSIADAGFTGLIDTGASSCNIPRRVIESLGVDLRSVNFNIEYAIADGSRVRAAVVPLPLTVQGISLNAVECAILESEPKPIKEALIGMSFLSRLRGVQLRGDTLILQA